MENKTYLDTHVILWLYSGKLELLSEKAKQIIDNNELYISREMFERYSEKYGIPNCQ